MTGSALGVYTEWDVGEACIGDRGFGGTVRGERFGYSYLRRGLFKQANYA